MTVRILALLLATLLAAGPSLADDRQSTAGPGQDRAERAELPPGREGPAGRSVLRAWQDLRETSTDLSILRLEWRAGSEALEHRRLERALSQ